MASSFNQGPTRHNLRDVDPAVIARVRAGVCDALTEFETSGGVRIPGSGWIVTAPPPGRTSSVS